MGGLRSINADSSRLRKPVALDSGSSTERQNTARSGENGRPLLSLLGNS